MQNHDYEKFTEIWGTAHELSANGKVLSNAAMTAAFRVMSEFGLSTISEALTRHTRKNKFAPTPADVIEIILGASRHVGADEAWAIALNSMDERETVVWTKEIAEARAIAWDVWQFGDKVAARMTFKDAYTRLIAGAGHPVWISNIGFEKERRAIAINHAVEIGRLPETKRLAIESPVSVQKLMAKIEERVRLAAEDGLIVDEIVKAKMHLGNIQAMLKKRQAESFNDGVERRSGERLEFERGRESALNKLSQLAN